MLATEGQRQLGMGSLQPAESCFRQAYALDSENPDALSGLAQTLEREGKEPEAIQAYRVLIYPKQGWGTSLEGDPTLRMHFALLLADGGPWPEAVQIYETTVPLIAWGSTRPAIDVDFDPTLPQPMLLAAMAHLVLGIEHENRAEPAEELSEYTEAQRLQPDLPITNFYLGSGLKKVGRISEARQAFAEAANSGSGDVKTLAEREMR